MNKPDGGMAFPSKATPGTYQESHDGMTLRDYFAAKAMQGLCSSVEMLNVVRKAALGSGISEAAGLSALSFSFADAMIEERGK